MDDIPIRRAYQYSQHARQPTSLDRRSIAESMQTRREMARLRPSSRGSSFNLSCGRANSTSFQSTDPISHMKDLDRVWHNPNTDQLAETLKVVMMTQGCCEPVPIEYNACILHVLEAYHDIALELYSKTRQLEDARKESAFAARQFEEKTMGWEMKEVDYKMEVKKLEVILAGGQRGLELVTLARSSSALRREKKAAEAKAGGNGQINDDVNVTITAGQRKELMVADFAAQKDSLLSRSFVSRYASGAISQNLGFDTPQDRGQQHRYAEVTAEVSEHVSPKKTSHGERCPRDKENALGISNSAVLPQGTRLRQRYEGGASSGDQEQMSADGTLSVQSQNTIRSPQEFAERRRGDSRSSTSTIPRGDVGRRTMQVEQPQKESDDRQKHIVAGIETALAAARVVTRGKV